jgi:hypothetical protein
VTTDGVQAVVTGHAAVSLDEPDADLGTLRPPGLAQADGRLGLAMHPGQE